jgi:SHS2 domain-containing protein
MHRWVEHTSELELELEAETVAGVLAEALAALAELLDPDGGAEGGAAQSVEVEVEAGDPAALLAAWVEELAYLAEGRSLIAAAIEEIAVDESGDVPRAVRARIRARRGDPRGLVKAVTYHRLRLERADRGWRGRVVLDV